MSLSYWLRAEVDDLLSEDTFFDMLGYAIIGEMLLADTFKLPLNQHRLRLK